MKTAKYPILMVLALALATTGCGKTERLSDDAVATTSAPSVVAPPTPGSPPPPSGTTPAPGGAAPLSYEFTQSGTNGYSTTPITTDNVLKVKFRVGTVQGNSVHSATELAVTLRVNGTEITPNYTSSNYTYGRVGETSNVIDFSSYLSPGVPVQVSVVSPKNDFYCTYAPNPFYYWDYNTGTYAPVNALYNQYPGCRKAVHSSHQWSGALIIQTNSTTAI